jgi:hypothetical protein
MGRNFVNTTRAENRFLKEIINQVTFFFKDIFALKKITKRLLKKRVIWCYSVCVISVLVIFLKFDENTSGPIIFIALLLFYFLGFWPLTRVKCPKCGNESWSTLFSNTGVRWCRGFWITSECPDCGKKFK